MAAKNEKQKAVEGAPLQLRGIQINLAGASKCVEKFQEVVFLEMPDFLIEHDAGGPFLGVKTEKGRYKIRLDVDDREFWEEWHKKTEGKRI